MKKVLICFLVLALLLAGLFLWKGAHHALILADALEEWLDADNADQTLTVQIMEAGFTAENDTVKPQVRQFTVSADTFWTEYGDDRLIGLSLGGHSAYLLGRNLYMDTGTAYSLDMTDGTGESLWELITGLILNGRITKTGDTYHLSAKMEELSLSGSVVMRGGISSLSLTVTGLADDSVTLTATLTPTETASHPIPQEVRDAIVLSAMEPPMPLSQPLNVLIPAMRELIPLEGSLDLGVECGLLNLSESVALSMTVDTIQLERGGVVIDLAPPEKLKELSPAAAGLLLLSTGEFTSDGDRAHFRISLDAETTAEIVHALVPQTVDLGIRFVQSGAVLTIEAGRLTGVEMTAEGAVPFLITEIPLRFTADLKIP